MQVVSGPIGRQRVHFEAPPADRLDQEIRRFLDWLNGASNEPPLLKAGLGHLWFVTLHPFDDGNGRIARAIGDLLLARADGSPQRFYSFSARFWQRWASTALNERQVKLLNRLLDGFEGRLSTSKWAALARCSPDTALRDINDLLARGLLRKMDAGGRSTRYELNDLPQ